LRVEPEGKWAKENLNLRIINTVTDQEEKPAGWQSEYGSIDRQMLTKHLSDKEISESTYGFAQRRHEDSRRQDQDRRTHGILI
jgi:hypothetical protein